MPPKPARPPLGAGALPPLPCGCPGSLVVADEDGHRAYHELVTAQTGLPAGERLTSRSLQAARLREA